MNIRPGATQYHHHVLLAIGKHIKAAFAKVDLRRVRMGGANTANGMFIGGLTHTGELIDNQDIKPALAK
jgi:hypothetical protein